MVSLLPTLKVISLLNQVFLLLNLNKYLFAMFLNNLIILIDSLGKNPGLALLWEDEKLRRRENHESSIIEIPQSQGKSYCFTLTNKSRDCKCCILSECYE